MEPIQPLSVKEFARWRATGARQFVQVDVREPWEVEIAAIPGGTTMPLGSLPQRFGALDPQTPTVLVCHHGGRSMQAARFLAAQGFRELYNLTGGVDAWACEIDHSMARY